ncbi:MAG TPA: lysylphosphatidylglycerol synthase transmembrane domain-containing protein [Tepidisphaeraceae bacterium]|nr:lysylphosphatidylglycerol synthase transmembrane domain-containing protein [Tepidisphaeraceae bacterium]
MKSRILSWGKFILRWGIAVVGVAWVLMHTSFQDRVLLLDRHDLPVSERVYRDATDSDSRFLVSDPDSSQKHWVSRDQLWTRPDRRSVAVQLSPGHSESARFLAYHPQGDKLDVQFASSNHGTIISASKVVGGYHVAVPYPLVDIGLDRLVLNARLRLLLAALLVLPVTYLITSLRWHWLLGAMEIYLSWPRTFVLNMVGSFYNTFMPGSTGGDLIRAYYAAKHTTHRIRAVLSVLVDRGIGLLALIILGGVMATGQLSVLDCRRVAVGCAAILSLTAVGLFVFYHPGLRRRIGLDWLLRKLPMQRQVTHLVEALELYGKRGKTILGSLLISFPVHMTVIVSATLAGFAFGLKMPVLYYWVCVPVIVLVGAIPISPQGAGVMELFAVELTKRQGITVSQAFALAMSIRVGAMFWNLVAGLFVLRGGYHPPTKQEEEGLETDEPDPAAPRLEPLPAAVTGNGHRTTGG